MQLSRTGHVGIAYFTHVECFSFFCDGDGVPGSTATANRSCELARWPLPRLLERSLRNGDA